MTPAERLREARGLPLLAVELEHRGLEAAAGEMLWGAVNHVIVAIVDYQSLTHSGRPMRRAHLMAHLQGIYQRNPPFANSLAVVGELHGHFYNKHMDRARHEAAMRASATFLIDLLSTREAQAIRQ